MIKKILLALAAMVLGFAAYVALQPPDFRVARSTTINAPPDAVYAQVDDFHKWQDWSPWAKLDPNAKVTFEGPASGKGASFKWSGNDDVGEGRMTIVEARPGEHVAIKLDFTRPMQDAAGVVFDLKPEGGKTHVTWSMSGEMGFVERAFCMLMGGEAMIGADYEKGLAMLKKLVEEKG